MISTTIYFLFAIFISVLLLLVNFILAPHNPYTEKKLAFECGYTSFAGQNRTQFSISFFIFALLFLLFDLELLVVYPYLVSSYANENYGLIILLLFLFVLIIGFAFELGKNALSIESRQNKLLVDYKHSSILGNVIKKDFIIRYGSLPNNQRIIGVQSNILKYFSKRFKRNFIYAVSGIVISVTIRLSRIPALILSMVYTEPEELHILLVTGFTVVLVKLMFKGVIDAVLDEFTEKPKIGESKQLTASEELKQPNFIKDTIKTPDINAHSTQYTTYTQKTVNIKE